MRVACPVHSKKEYQYSGSLRTVMNVNNFQRAAVKIRDVFVFISACANIIFQQVFPLLANWHLKVTLSPPTLLQAHT